MSTFRRFLLRIWNALSPGRAERELEREVDSHLHLLADEYRRRGLTEADARRAARVAIGGVEPAKNGQRDARSFVWLDDLRRDTAYAIRTLVRAPGFAAVTILTLGLSIGASTAIFSVVDHVLLRPLPLPHAERLVRLHESNPTAERPLQDVSPAHAADWRRASTSLDLLATIGGTRVTMTGAAEPESLIGMLVGPEFFQLTGVTLALGRPFEESEYTAIANAALGPLAVREPITGDAAVIISHALWLRQFGGDRNVVGRVIELNGARTRVAGVMPAAFRVDESSWGVSDCWLPQVPSRMMAQRRFRQFMAVGRLKPGVTLEHAQAELTSIAAGLAREHPKEDGGWGIRVEPLKESLVTESRSTLLILLGGVACLLLIACANIASLLLMRAAGRGREVAIRMAMGAGRSRLIRQWLTESTLLALLGGLAGFVAALWAVPAVIANVPLKLPRLDTIAVDARIVFFCAATALLTGLLCGLAPSLGLAGVTVASLRSTGVSDRARHRLLRPSLLGAQIGLTVVLLVGAGLMGRTLLAVYGVDLGFNPHHVLTFQLDLRGAGHNGLADVRAFNRDLTARLVSVAGIEAAGVGGVPLQGQLKNEFLVEQRQEPLAASMNIPSPGYFRGLGLRLVSGRLFNDHDDENGQPVAIVNRAFAGAAWGTSDVLGRRVRDSLDAPWMTVVGVIDDVRASSLEADPPPVVFVPTLQCRSATMSSYVVRTTGDPRDAIPLVRDAVRAMDPKVALTRVETLDERLSHAIAPRLFNAWLVGLFSLLALLLAVVGIYGLIGETVASRTAEIGIRLALGAGRLRVIRLAVGGTLGVTAAGLVVGLAAAAAATRSLGSMLFGVTPLDPLTLVAMPLIFLAVGAVAALAPARRATKVDPVVALRGE